MLYDGAKLRVVRERLCAARNGGDQAGLRIVDERIVDAHAQRVHGLELRFESRVFRKLFRVQLQLYPLFEAEALHAADIPLPGAEREAVKSMPRGLEGGQRLREGAVLGRI